LHVFYEINGVCGSYPTKNVRLRSFFVSLYSVVFSPFLVGVDGFLKIVHSVQSTMDVKSTSWSPQLKGKTKRSETANGWLTFLQRNLLGMGKSPGSSNSYKARFQGVGDGSKVRNINSQLDTCINPIGRMGRFGVIRGGCYRVFSPNLAAAWTAASVRSRYTGNSPPCTASVLPTITVLVTVTGYYAWPGGGMQWSLDHNLDFGPSQ